MLASRWIPWAAAVTGATLACAVWATREERLVPMPPLPDPAIIVPLLRLWQQPVPPPPPSGPTHAMPCVPGDQPSLHAKAGTPIVCTDKGCIAIDLDRHATTLTDRPADAAPLPAHATVPGGLGPHLAKAVAAIGHADATLDRSTVVVGDEIWNVAADRTIALRRPEINPRGPEHSVEVLGDLLLVRWDGSCTDAMCFVSELVDRKGREVGWIDATKRVLVLDDRFFLAIGTMSTFEIRDLHTGAQVSMFDPLLSQGDFIDIVRLDAGRYAVLRAAGLDIEIALLEIYEGHMMFGDRMTLPSCE